MNARKDGLQAGSARSGLVFRCACGREQAFAPPNASGGITIPEAKSLGWKANYEPNRTISDWTCPFCDGAATADDPAWSSEDLRPVDEHGGG